MKKIRLTEQDLKKVISESVKRILKEWVYYGPAKPFEEIINAANQIMDSLKHVEDENYEPWDDSDGADMDPQVYEWAKKVKDDAEYWLQHNSSNSPINGGENW